jgi:hypothetical protein
MKSKSTCFKLLFVAVKQYFAMQIGDNMTLRRKIDKEHYSTAFGLTEGPTLTILYQ